MYNIQQEASYAGHDLSHTFWCNKCGAKMVFFAHQTYMCSALSCREVPPRILKLLSSPENRLKWHREGGMR